MTDRRAEVVSLLRKLADEIEQAEVVHDYRIGASVDNERKWVEVQCSFRETGK